MIDRCASSVCRQEERFYDANDMSDDDLDVSGDLVCFLESCVLLLICFPSLSCLSFFCSCLSCFVFLACHVCFAHICLDLFS